MSEYEPEEARHEQEINQAEVKTAKWSPWVWVVPAIALVVVGALIVRYGFFGGGDITVRFVEARGLDRYSPVRFRGAKVGTVQKITIDKDLRSVLVRITMDASMSHALRKDTRFWIVEPGLEGGGIGGILSGTYVAISPGGGAETTEFVGQEYAPILFAPEEGRTYLLETNSLGSIAAGAPVQFQGMRVGRVLGATYDEARRISSVHVFVVDRWAGYVRQSTRFFRGSGLALSFSGGGLSLGDASLASLLNAPISFYTPEVLAGAAVKEGTHFELYDSRSAAIAAADGPHLTYMTFFPGPIKGLAPGTPVQMKGYQVGRVRDVRLQYISTTGSLQTPVTLEIDPRLLDIAVTDATTREDLRRTLNNIFGTLVQKGMRATLASSLVLPGASAVALDIVAPPGTGRLVVTSDPPIIPAARDRGLEGALSAVTDVANTIRSLPLREIAESMRSATARLNTLVSDPALNESLQRLNRSLAQVEKITTTTSENIEPLIASLKNTAAAAEAAAKRAEQLMGTSQRQNYDLGELIKELTRAAEAVRALSQYLTENPDSLLKGRPK